MAVRGIVVFNQRDFDSRLFKIARNTHIPKWVSNVYYISRVIFHQRKKIIYYTVNNCRVPAATNILMKVERGSFPDFNIKYKLDSRLLRGSDEGWNFKAGQDSKVYL